MGIPGLYSILLSQWPSLRENPSVDDSCDALYLDMGSFLHTCLSLATDEEEMFTNVSLFISRLMEIARPTKEMLLAFDGVPPFAKLKHQHRRRQITGKSSGMNPHLLTPGTEFLARLQENVIKSVSDLQNGVKYGALSIIVSGPSTPGEGEQKIMQRLRSSATDYSNVVVYSLDADMIVMTVGIHKPDVRILRETAGSRGRLISRKSFEIFSIPRLRAKIWLNSPNPTEKEMTMIMKDFGMLLTIFGNDFLPTPDGMELSRTTFMRELQSLHSLHRQGKHLLKDGKINSDGLYCVLKFLSKAETDAFRKYKPISQTYLATRSLELELAGLSISHKKSSSISFKRKVETERYGQWKTLHYRRGFKADNTDVQLASKDYIEGLRWLARYYHTGECSTWHYRHKFTPRPSDLLSYMLCEDREIHEYHDDLTFGPLHQLALVIPKESGSLLPDVYQTSNTLRDMLYKNVTSIDGSFSVAESISAINFMKKELDSKLAHDEQIRNQVAPVILISGNELAEGNT